MFSFVMFLHISAPLCLSYKKLSWQQEYQADTQTHLMNQMQ